MNANFGLSLQYKKVMTFVKKYPPSNVNWNFSSSIDFMTPLGYVSVIILCMLILLSKLPAIVVSYPMILAA